MIYLIDDKKNRQKDYGWYKERFEKYTNTIEPIYAYDEITEEIKRKEIFSNGNIILFHESFFDNVANPHDRKAMEIRKLLSEFVRNNNNFKVVYFSGSKGSRKLDNNIGYMPVSILYQNLKIFINKVQKGDNDLRYLLFGEDYKIEEKLLEKLESANNNIEDSIENKNSVSKNFIGRASQDEIETIFDNAVYDTFFLDEKYNYSITDEYLSDKVKDWFTREEYDNLFIPIGFGPVLSDFNGLRFAMHIRCTNTPNQLKNIFLYSFVDYSSLIENEYFDVLKTKNVHLIEYNKAAFSKMIESSNGPLVQEELSKEIRKIKLDPPKNYEDSHSIANEWAINRWANSIKAYDDDIEKIINKVDNQLYFKYLNTIYPKQELIIIPEEQLKIQYTGEAKILYIDDEADKGWYEIFSTILYDINKLDFNYLDEELKSKTRDEIIAISINKIKAEEIDLVILDYRLHPQDFSTQNIHEVTGLRLLQEVKSLNPGIQVIIFSATNKVWNLQALQEAGSDGFIIKESAENSKDSSFTLNVIDSFISSISTTLKRRFLKRFFKDCVLVEKNLNSCETEDDTKYDEFINDLKSHIKLIESAAKKVNLNESTTLDIVFLSCYNFLEKFKHYYLDEEDYQLVLGIDQVDMNRYYISKGKIYNDGKFLRNNSSDNPSWFNVLVGLFIDYFNIANIDDKEIKDLNNIKDKRNKYIHSKKQKFDEKEVLMILTICEKITSQLRE